MDIDIDSQASRRKQILQALKNYFGEDRVLNIATFGTEGSKSAVLTACRALGIDNDEAQYIASLIPFERGSNYSISQCLYGDEELERKPVKEFINALNQYEGLKEIIIKIEGLVNKRSIHASGVYIFNQSYIEQNSMMLAPNGQPITCMNMADSDYCGALKEDMLTISALDKVRNTLDLLLKDGVIEWQGTLKATYDKYLHPDVLDYETQEMWELIGENAIPDLFQFDTEQGLKTAKKVKPKSLVELATANSLMRLVSSDEEQPVDLYIKFKSNPDIWFNEMKKYGLNNREISVLRNHLDLVFGVADTQEIVMELSMDKGISNFDIKKANKLRKSIAKKKRKLQEEAKELFFEEGIKNDTRPELLNYVWDKCVKIQLGYSFSKNHTFPYSCIAVQEMNLFYHYNPLYWQTACLSVNSGADEDNEDNKTTNYGKVAAAIGNMQQRGVQVSLPSINSADFGFKPDVQNDKIIFGLKGINGIGDDVVFNIVGNRPYKSYEDFLQRMVLCENSLVKQSQMIQLLKAGCFDEFGDRVELMSKFITLLNPPKSKLNMQNFSSIIEKNMLPEQLHIYIRYFRYKKYISQKQFTYKTIEKPKDRYIILDDISTQFFNDNFTDVSIVDYVDNRIVISEKKFKKEYDEKMEVVKEWLSKESVVSLYNQRTFEEEWNKYCKGSISKWEMDSVSYYQHDHELLHIDKYKYNLVNFFDLPEEPIPTGYKKWRGREVAEYKIERIAGTVLDKDKNKHLVTILTTDGVVTVKFNAGKFSFYDKRISRVNDDGSKTVLENSFFTRGNLIMFTGYRRGNQFKNYKYNNSIYQHSVALITNVDENGNLTLKTERTEVEG